ncbi:MAG: ABC transporter permease [Bryobacteraceae bacterium]
MPKLVEDLKFAARLHGKALGFTMVALSTLSLGIGASTAVFSAVNAVLLKPLPYPEPQRIVIPWRLAPKDANIGYNEIPWGTVNFERFQKMSSFESIAAFKSNSFNLTGSGEPVQLEGLRVSSGFFHTLGIVPLLGRVFTENEDHPGSGQEVILSYHLWRTHFHGDDGILGRGIDLNGLSYNVIGIMPAGFDFPRAEEMPPSFDFPRQAGFWIPLGLPAAPQPGDPDDLAVIARLKHSVSIAGAQTEMNAFASSMDRESPDSKGWFHSRVTGLNAQVVGDTEEPLLLILGAAGVLLLIAFVNVANLLLTRSIGRRNEFALRAALGATRASLVRQLLTESVVLSLAGGVIGLMTAEIAIHLLKAFGPSNIPRLQEVTLDWRVLAFAFITSLVCSAFFGLAPAAGLPFENLATPLREGGRGGTGNSRSAKLRGLFLVAQIALAFVLVIASGLIIRTFLGLLAVDPGFNPERVLTFELSMPGTKYKDNDRVAFFYQKALPALRAMPGVAHAGLVETIPMAGASDGSLIRLPDHPALPGKEPFANYNVASPDYFSAVGTPLLSGRAFLDSDTASRRPVAVINAAMAKKFWQGEDPIGKQVGLADPQSPLMNVVGVVADVKQVSLREDTGPQIYVPFTQKPFPSMLVMHVALRARMDPALLTSSVRQEIHRLDADLPVSNVATLSSLVDQSLVSQRFSMWLIGAFGIVSLLLACIGLYGVVSYSVLQRSREMGLRMALGAKRTTVIAMVLGQGARLTGVGMAAGLIAALAVTRLMANLLYGVQPTDWITFATVVPLLAAVALAACYVPAHRASRVDPATALRNE